MTEQVAVKGQQPAEEKKEKTKKGNDSFSVDMARDEAPEGRLLHGNTVLDHVHLLYGHPCPAFDSAQLYFL